LLLPRRRLEGRGAEVLQIAKAHMPSHAHSFADVLAVWLFALLSFALPAGLAIYWMFFDIDDDFWP
jgi:hypothetical protein